MNPIFFRPASFGESFDEVEGPDDFGDLDSVLVDVKQPVGAIDLSPLFMTRPLWMTRLTLLTIIGWTLTVGGFGETGLDVVWLP